MRDDIDVHVELLAVPKPQRLDRVAGFLADDVELALERVLVHRRRPARDEDLADDRLDVLRPLGKPAVVRRHVAPAEQNLAFARHRALDLLLARHPGGRLLRQEHHADAVLADRGQREALRAACLAQEPVRQLDQDAGAVALQRIGARRAAMGQVPQDRQRLRYDGVPLLALDVGDEAEAAGIVLIRGIVQALPRRRPTRRSFRTFLHHDLTQIDVASGRRGFVAPAAGLPGTGETFVD